MAENAPSSEELSRVLDEMETFRPENVVEVDYSTEDGPRPKELHQCDGCAVKAVTDHGEFPSGWEAEDPDDEDSAEFCPECQ